MAMVLAHQGGWDEILFVALPLGLFAFLLFIANRRAQAQLDEEERAQAGDAGQGEKDETRGARDS